MNILTVDQAADYLQVSNSILYPMISSGKIPAARVKGQWRLIQEDIDDWLRKQYEAHREAACRTKEQAQQNGGSLSAECAKALAPKTKTTLRLLKQN